MIVFNNFRLTELSGATVKILDIVRPLAPEIVNAIKTGGNNAGGYDFGKRFNPKPIKVKLGILTTSLTTMQDAFRLLVQNLMTDDAKELTFDDVPDKCYLARLTKIGEPVQKNTYTVVDLEFTCINPFLFGNEQTVNLVADSATFSVAGVLSAKPVFTLTFTTSATYIQIYRGSAYIKITDNFVANDVLTIDTNTGAIKKNGVRIIDKLDWQNSTFFELQPGSNTITTSPTSKCSTQIKYRERWY